MTDVLNFIDGGWVQSVAGTCLDNVDPARGCVYAKVPDSDERDVNSAVDAARRAFPAWSKTPVVQRSRILSAIADSIDANADRLARAESVDTGKPLSLARSVDIPRAAASLRYYAAAAQHVHSECHATDDVALNYTLRTPRGVAGTISPWNLPLYLLTWKIAPALATGNTVVAKPSEITPVTAHLLTELAKEAGLPPGVLNVVHGTGVKAGAALVAHPDVPTISFTGGTATGEEVARVAGPMFKKIALELGGKNPNIILADADMDRVLPESLRSSFANQGQICLCGSRIFVEKPAYDSFVEKFVEATRNLRVGDPLEEGVDLGAMVSKEHQAKVLSYLDLAHEEGGRILCGGGVPDVLPERCKNGFFVQPTVITGLPLDCRVNREEIFGPVVSIMPFDGDDQVVQYANDTKYGLSASIWTSDVTRAHRLAHAIDAGTVWINCWMLRDLRVPFGGMKSSGVGREGGDESLRFFTEPKNVCVKL